MEHRSFPNIPPEAFDRAQELIEEAADPIMHLALIKAAAFVQARNAFVSGTPIGTIASAFAGQIRYEHESLKRKVQH